MHFRCVLYMLSHCVLLGLDCAEPMIRDGNFSPPRFAPSGFSPPRKGGGARMGQDFSPAPRGGVGMGLDFLDLPCPTPPRPCPAPRC